MNIGDLMSFSGLVNRIADGYVTAREHPALPLTILNYTAKAQYERTWDEVTRQCRGLIVHSVTGEVIARPFPKFFNLGEMDELPEGPPTFVHDKLDGSLGIAYEYDGHIGIATRGSFTSEQALWATHWLITNHPMWSPEPGVTELFEIVYPGNRIVLNYGDYEGLIRLARLDLVTGADRELLLPPFPAAAAFEPDDLELLAQLANSRKETEGLVCTWVRPGAPSVRIKLKSDEYVRLHRVVTGLSNRTIWEHLAAGTYETLLAEVPDEFYAWATEQHDALVSKYEAILHTAQFELDQAICLVGNLKDRKALAERIKHATYPGLCFALLDGKDASERIWRMLKPERETPLISVSEDAA